MTTKAYGYVRVSSKGQLSGYGIDRQQETIEAYAQRNGVEIIRFYEDAYTGTEGDRPEFVTMLADVIGNGTKVVIVECLDRLSRDLMVQTVLLSKLESEGITLISALTGEDVTASMRDDPMRRALVQIQGVFAELDRNLTVRKLRKGREAKRRETGRCEGQKPFGAMPEEEAALARIKQLRRKPRGGERLSFQAIADKLNEEKLPTRTGVAWSRGAVHAIVSRLGW